MDIKKYTEDMIERYIYQVNRFLPGRNKKDILKELRTLIWDMIEERTKGRTLEKKDVEIVLMELGTPAELASKYGEKKRYLIGPELYPRYIWILKIVLLIAVIAGPAAVLISRMTSGLDVGFAGTGQLWFMAVWEMLEAIFGSAVTAFAMVTLIFAIMERAGVPGNIFSFQEGMDFLPPVPDKNARISKGEPIASLIFLMILFVIMVFIPQIIGAVVYRDGVLTRVPIFQLSVLKRAMPLFCIWFACSAVAEIVKLVEGRYTMRLTVVVLIGNGISLLLSIFIFTQFKIWNPQFIPQLQEAFPEMNPDLGVMIWNLMTNFFLLIVIFAILLECGTVLYKGIKYRDYDR